MGQVHPLPGGSTAIPDDQKRWTRLLAFIICLTLFKIEPISLVRQRIREHGVMGNVIIKNRTALRICVGVPSYLVFFYSSGEGN